MEPSSFNQTAKRKAHARLLLRRHRDAIPAAERRRREKRLAARLFALEIWRKAARVGLYMPMGSELRLDSLLLPSLFRDKALFVPIAQTRTHALHWGRLTKEAWQAARDPSSHDFHRSSFGILEPRGEVLSEEEISSIDLLLVPGLGFTADGDRLGYGGGYYDRFLARHARPRALSVDAALHLDPTVSPARTSPARRTTQAAPMAQAAPTAQAAHELYTIGVAFREQRMDDLPTDAHDVRLHTVLFL